MELIKIRHPLVQHKLGLMRNINTNSKQFRELTVEISSLITYAATADLLTQNVNINGWHGPVTIDQIESKKITIVPIMRAGLGMLPGVQQCLTNASISMVGFYRDEQTLKPTAYFQKLANHLTKCTAIVIDIMLATGKSADSTIKLLKNAGCRSIKLLTIISAPEGIRYIKLKHPDIILYTASIDQKLNENGYIIPGLGDVGNRLFGTY